MPKGKSSKNAKTDYGKRPYAKSGKRGKGMSGMTHKYNRGMHNY